MTLASLLLMPLRLCQRSSRWLALFISIVCGGGAITVAVFSSNAKMLFGVAMILGAGIGLLWAFYLSILTLVAMDARQLRLPRLQRDVIACLLIYGVLSVVPVTLLLGLAHANIPAVAMLLVLCVLFGLGFALLPRYVVMLLGFLPSVRLALAPILMIPGPGDSGFMAWSPLVALALLLACIHRWRVLMRSIQPAELGFGSSMVLQYRRGSMGRWSNLSGLESPMSVRQRPAWMQPKADLREVGPSNPQTALRVALGGWYLPKTLSGHLQSLAAGLLSLLLFVASMMLISVHRGQADVLHKLWLSGGIAMLAWVGIFGGAMLMIVTVQLMLQRWRRVNGELPLLALLPGLGDATTAKRQLLRASLQRPLCVQGALLVIISATAYALHVRGMVLLALTGTQLGCAATLVACVLGVVGGRPLPNWAFIVLIAVVTALASLAAFLPLVSLGSQPWPWAAPAIGLFLVAWLLTGVVLLWMGRRGWRALQERPHAFLSNG
ncbi:hypothetical protein ISN76_00110 [Dyella halodurans]|uniref:ABC transporter permease n=1 Tax=Dyella halodurans TaxID=1920171 RepID=A0ABV9BXZ0_9GAMM|nr:hypothetical protein [Dyella halodurans]